MLAAPIGPLAPPRGAVPKLFVPSAEEIMWGGGGTASASSCMGDFMERFDRITLVEDDVRRAVRQIRYLPAASVAVAAFAFLLTTVVWRLVHQTSAVEAAVQQSIAGINRFGAATSGDLARLHEGLVQQTVATGELEARLLRLESSGTATLERVQAIGVDMARQAAIADQVRNELTRATAGVAQTRQEILERLAVHTDRNATARDAMIREVHSAISQMEQSLLAQAEDFQHQKQQFDAAAERDRATRRVMLHEATQAFTVQVEGLRQILDGLRVDSATVDAGVSPGGVTSAEVSSGAGDTGEETESDRVEEPATAARDKEAVLE